MEEPNGTLRPKDVLAKLRDAVATRTVVGDPVTVGEVTVIPVVRTSSMSCRCGGCGPKEPATETPPAGKQTSDEQAGGGLAIRSKPVGAFVINKGEVGWQPAFDLNKVIVGGQVIALAAILTVRAIIKSRARRAERG